jgi:tetratricopeptide (TPR) repeat protein
MAVQESARAAYGRGEVAEAEVRWEDAADHYERASELSPDYDALFRATHLLQLAGQYDRASVTAAKLVAQARELSDEKKLSSALERHATVLQRQGRFGLAETRFREALEIIRATSGEAYLDYATDLNNLAGVVQVQGRFAEDRPLFQQALLILQATLPADHPNIAAVKKSIASLPLPPPQQN